jgi:hypothetical protein
MVRRGRPTTIAFTINTVGVSRGDAGDAEVDDAEVETCCICRNTYCCSEDDDDCCLAVTTLGCCTQTVCCRCLTKMLLRCTCTDECTAVVAYCAFCRRISPASALDIYRGACLKECSACVKQQRAEQQPAAAPTPAANAGTDDEDDDEDDGTDGNDAPQSTQPDL